jgi:hypothetical protein
VSIPALFSLIAAALLTLLPLFLMLARNRMRRRDTETVAAAERGAAERGSGTGAPAAIQGGAYARVGPTWEPGEPRPILDRVTLERDQRASEPRPGSPGATVKRTAVAARFPGPGGEQRRTRQAGEALEARLSGLSPLQRAVVYREILGPPVGLRDTAAGGEPYPS